MTPLTLTEEEISVMMNTSFLRTKNRVMQKMAENFAVLANECRTMIKNRPELYRLFGQESPKISKGEHYEGLPYIMLDYPRIFTKGNFCAVRIMFYWGNFISISLLISGEWQRALLPFLLTSKDLKEWDVDLSPTPWVHHIRSGKRLEDFSKEALDALSFLKLTKTEELSNHTPESIITHLPNDFKEILQAFMRYVQKERF